MAPTKKAKAAPAPRPDASRIEAHLASLRSRDGLARQKARRALTRIGKPVVRELIPLLKDPKDQVRWEAAKALADIADKAAAVDLVAALEDDNTDVRWLAAEGLIAIGRPSLVPLLEALLRREDSVWLREGAHHVLHDLPKTGVKEVVTSILSALEGGDPGFGMQRPVRKALRELKG